MEQDEVVTQWIEWRKNVLNMEQEAVVKVEIKKKVTVYKTRFSDAIWYDWLQDRPVFLLGLGGIGSWTSLALARIGCFIYGYDDDILEQVNMAGQLYNVNLSGTRKADAIYTTLTSFVHRPNIVLRGLYTENSESNKIVIAAFDNMASRKLAFERWIQFYENDPDPNKSGYLFIDGRLLAEDYQIYTVTPDKIGRYRETLFDDSEVGDQACTLKSTSHCSMSIASDITGLLTNFASNEAFGSPIREVPFMISKSIALFRFETTD